jgi:hypothetical protein
LGQAERIRFGSRLDEFSGAFASEQLVLMYPRCDSLFRNLNVVWLHCTSEFFDQNAASVPNRAGIFFGQS